MTSMSRGGRSSSGVAQSNLERTEAGDRPAAPPAPAAFALATLRSLARQCSRIVATQQASQGVSMKLRLACAMRGIDDRVFQIAMNMRLIEQLT
jgi:hypothetical protein